MVYSLAEKPEEPVKHSAFRLARTCIAALSACLPATGQCWGPLQAFSAPDGVDEDEFGALLDADGSTLLVGAPQDSVFGSDGAAYVYERDLAGNWVPVSKLTDVTGEGVFPSFGAAGALDGDTIVVGNGPDFQVFERSSGSWGLTQVVPTSLQLFGAVALDGDTVAVARTASTVFPPSEDGVLVHERNLGGPNAWGEAVMIQPSQTGNPKIGWSMDIDGDTLAVSEPDWHGQGGFGLEGRVRIFMRNLGGPDAWGEAQVIGPSGNVDEAHFGLSLALEGDTLVVGAQRQEEGVLYVFRRVPTGTGAWVESERFTPPHTDVGSWPSAVALSENTLAALDFSAGAAGAVFLYAGDEVGRWHYLERHDIPDQFPAGLFATAVGLAGQETFVGHDAFTLPGGVQVFGNVEDTTGYCTPGTSTSGCAAYIRACGTPSATASSGFALSALDVEYPMKGLFFHGSNGRQATPWGNGTSFQCVVPPVKRGPQLTPPTGVGNCAGSFQEDLNARWCPTCPKPSQNPGAGAIVQAQFWYRDPLNTSNQTTAFSAAIEFVVEP